MTHEEAIELVLARLETMPDTLRIHAGSTCLGRTDLVDHVKRQDAFGKAFVRMQIEYIKSMTGA